MPNLDGGHYLLTALVPVLTGAVERDDGSVTAPGHALREALASLPTAVQSAACAGTDRLSPFARCTRTHFGRLFVVDQPSYNGRDPSDAIVESVRRTDLLAHQRIDCLLCPWLVVVIDFDTRADEADGGLRSYLLGLWTRTEPEFAAIFRYCHGFEAVRSAEEFASWLTACQIETTMPFNDYWPGAPQVPALGPGALAGVVAGVTALALLALGVALGATGASDRWLVPGFVPALAIGIWAACRFVMRRGARSWPAAPAATLPDVLKSLYIQQRFARFAVAHQLDDPRALHGAFGAFLAVQRPEDTQMPTRLPGTVDA